MKATVFWYSEMNRYCAHIEGPWYDDSNPEGYGATPDEAARHAWDCLLKIQSEVNEFVSKGKPEFELVK